MLEDQVAYLLQRYLGNYVRGLNKEALKISVWRGDVELTNMELKPEALNALKLPVKVKAGFLGSVKLKVPWSRLGQDPVLVYLDRIFLLAEPATVVEGSSEDAVQEVKKSRIRELEKKLLETQQQLNSEMNKSWLGSLINTVIGNLKLSISNIHIRYEDPESNPGHPFAAGLTLDKLSAFTVNDKGEETFLTGGALERIQKSVKLERMAIYLDSDISQWYIKKPWENLLPSEWEQIFKFGTEGGRPAANNLEKHSYILQPVSGSAKYSKDRLDSSINKDQPLQNADVELDDVTLCLSKDGYRDMLKLADNFTAFNQRLKYAHYRPRVSVKTDPRAWWKYACKAASDQMKKASGKLPWEQVLRFARLRKKYISLYAALLRSDLDRTVIDDNEEIEELDRELDIEVILQWRMLAHKFVEQSVGSELLLRKQSEKKSWWSFGWNSQPVKDENEPGDLTGEDWKRLNDIIGYKEDNEEELLTIDKGRPYILLKLRMKHNASKLIDTQECLADLSCDNLESCMTLYPEAKIVDMKLGSYRLLSPNGLLAESESESDSLVALFSYKPLDGDIDWSLVAKASPCYVTYLKDSINQIIDFFQSSATVSQALVQETASAVQMTIDEVKRTAAKQMSRALKERTRFYLDLDIAAPKITIPTDFYPDSVHPTKLLIDLGKLVIRSQDDPEYASPEEMNMYTQFNLVLKDVSAFLVDGDYSWSLLNRTDGSSKGTFISLLPVIDKCGVFLKLQQIRSQVASLPLTRLAMRLPSIGFHFSPSRYHRLMQVVKIFKGDDTDHPALVSPWDDADYMGWLYHLARKGVGGREAVWQRRYFCVVGPVLYMLETPESKNYKQYVSLRGKNLYQVPADLLGNVEHVLAVCDADRSYSKVVEDASALILRCNSEDSRKTWQSYLQGAIYRASVAPPISGLIESLSDSEGSDISNKESTDSSTTENFFVTGLLDELKISFSYSDPHRQSPLKMLLAEEKRLFEFRAIGGQVEVSVRASDIFIGTVLKALEIEDLYCRKRTSQICYLARSFIRSADTPSLLVSLDNETQSNNDGDQLDGDDEFYEASEDLNGSVGSPLSPANKMDDGSGITADSSDFEAPCFTRVAGLLPFGVAHVEAGEMGVIDSLDSFVKAQIVISDQNSPLYTNVDNQVAVTLSTLSFYLRRPTLLAIMDFINAINSPADSSDNLNDMSSTSAPPPSAQKESVNDGMPSVPMEEPVESLLGKGKSRVIFYLLLNMARAEIFLMKENDAKLATLAQDNFLTDIKVYPSSFSIKASLGNLRISDDSLHSNHMYFWACDMRNPGGSSFVELEFCSFHADDEDYEGYEYSLHGQLSEVRVIYLNRFIQEVISYFVGLVPSEPKDVIRLKDEETNSEKQLTKSEIEGSPAVKLDLSLKKPIILMPKRTDSVDYLKLDVVQITVQNTCRWFGGNRSEMKALHVDILQILVEDINLNVGSGSELGESIIQDVKGVSLVIQRTLRDLLHEIPSIEVTITIEELKAALSSKEYEIIVECTQTNISETPNIVPSLKREASSALVEVGEPSGTQGLNPAQSESQPMESWIATKVSMHIDMVELNLHYGITRDASLATLQVSGVWLLYKSNTVGEGFLSTTLKDLIVVDDREGTAKELRLAIGKPKMGEYNPSATKLNNTDHNLVEGNTLVDSARKYNPAILILDARFCEKSIFVSLCIQRPQLLVALDFLLDIAEFFVPTIRGELLYEDSANSHALILDQPIFHQPSTEFYISPTKPLVADDERFDLFIYDGGGGILYLKDRHGLDISCPSMEALVHVGNGKKLQFRNVTIKIGSYLDSCVLLGVNSSYSANQEDNVFLEGENASPTCHSSGRSHTIPASQNDAAIIPTELVFELQAIGPELTFYNKSRNAEQQILSNKLLHAQMDASCRLVSNGNTIDMNAEVLSLTLESNGIKILEPFDASAKFSNASGKTSIKLVVSDIFMNFSFSILRLFLAVEEDILSFLRTTSKKSTVLCSEFDRIGTIKCPTNDQVYALWRPRAPSGFAVLGDYLTPLDKPPTKGVVAVNSSLIHVKRPKSFKLIWPPSDVYPPEGVGITESNADEGSGGETVCSIWFPEAPKGYVALGCVASSGRAEPPASSVFCISASLVSPCDMRDCIIVGSFSWCPNMAFWRVDNSIGSFLPADPATLNSTHRGYELRQLYFGAWENSSQDMKGLDQVSSSSGNNIVQSERSSTVNSRRRFEAVATFQLIWWNQGSGSRKKLSIWRPVVPGGMVFFGDIAVPGYEPPNTCIVLQDSEDYGLYKSPSDFQLVGQIKKQRKMDTISFWMPQAPPGFVALGCVSCKGTPKQSDFKSLRCIRADMVSTDQFSDESLWDTSDSKYMKEPFSIWTVRNDLGTFFVWNGYKKPPKRFGLKLSGPDLPSGSDDTVIDAEIRTFSAALFDDYGGLIVPLCNISMSGIGFTLSAGSDSQNSNVTFSLAARSYNDKYDSWEPLIEPVDGSLRYQYNPNAPGVASELRITSTRDLNLNVSVSNANMILQAYASWNSLSQGQDSLEEASSPSVERRSMIEKRSMIAVHQRRHHYIVPQNKLGKDIFIRTSGVRGLPNIIEMPSGDSKALKLPAPKNMLYSHLKGDLLKKPPIMLTIIIAEAQFLKLEGMSSHQYSVAVRVYEDQSHPSQSYLKQQKVRTCGIESGGSESSDITFVKWNEVFFFKIDSVDHCMLEFTVVDTGKDEPVGSYSCSLNELTRAQGTSNSIKDLNEFWLELPSVESSLQDRFRKACKIKCAVFLRPRLEAESLKSINGFGKSGSIQISPYLEGPWTTMRLNYGSPVACWQLGNNLVASEVRVNDGNRYVDIRSLVSVRNNTEFTLDLCLKLRATKTDAKSLVGEKEAQYDGSGLAANELFESQKYSTANGWLPCTDFEEELSRVNLPLGWEWIDEWHLDRSSVKTVDGWVYAPDFESLKWPDSYDSSKSVNRVRQRRWIRNKKHIAEDLKSQIMLGPLKPGETIPIPLPCVDQSASYLLHLKPSTIEAANQYSWSSVMDVSAQSRDLTRSDELPEVCVSTLVESEKLLHCTEVSGSSSNTSRGAWFCLTIQATEIAKDIQFNPIQDWTIVVRPPVTIANYLPLMSEICLLEMQATGHLLSCYRGVSSPGESVKVYDADIRSPLYFSLLPQKGWLPLQEAVLISHPSNPPSKTISLRSSVSGRIVQIIVEQNNTNEVLLQPKNIKVYSPYWLGIARCPGLSFRLVDVNAKKSKHNPLSFHTKKITEVILEEITEEEMHEGYTIASALNFKSLGLSASISSSGEEHFGPVKDLSPLGDMDGSLDIFAYNADGNCMQLFVSSKPCPYQSVPTKVISVRPFMTFTNRVGQNMLLKFTSEDEPKNLRVSDTRVAFVHCQTEGPHQIQVRLHDTEWTFPIQILKEDTLTLVSVKHDGTRIFLRAEIRGYEEGSRFVIVFRLGSANGPIRIENRTRNTIIRFRQTGFGDNSWVQLQPLSTTRFSWEDPYGQKIIDAEFFTGINTEVYKVDLDKAGFTSIDDKSGFFLHVANIGDIKVVRFMSRHSLPKNLYEGSGAPMLGGNWGSADIHAKTTEQGSPLELILELGVIAVSIIDNRPRELAYLYMEKLFISYSTGYDGGTTSRFKLILGYMQLDNQLPLSVLPVLLAPDQTPDIHHPVFKMTITVRNENLDGLQIYPYVYIRVVDKIWRLNVHEPIIWAFVDFFNNLQLDRIPQNSSVTQVDPEIRVDLIDISEVRLKISLETAPAQRPHGLLGVWGPVLSAVGNAFKIQVHLRKVTHRDRFLRRSSVVSAIKNRIWRDLIHNPLHLIFSVDVLGMTSSTLASLSKGFAELSTDGQFLQLRSKQVWSRRITGVGDGIVQGTEALAQGFVFGVSGVVRKPVESARQNGILGLAHGLGQAFLGFFVQPMSGALDFFSLTVDGIGASCSRCLEILNNKKNFQRIRNPRAFHSDNVLREYSEREALGQMILYLAEASRNLGCTEIFKEPSKFAWSDCYEDHFTVAYQRIVLVTNRRVMLLQCLAPDKMDKRPCKIMWDVPWEEVMSLELAKAGFSHPSHLIIHLKTFRRGESFVRVIKCNTELLSGESEPQAVRICSVTRKMWKAHSQDVKQLLVSQRHGVSARREDAKEPHRKLRAIIKSVQLSSSDPISNDQKFVEHSVNFSRIWSSEREPKGRCAFCRKQSVDNGEICSIWRPICPDGYVSIGDIARPGCHPPNVAAIYHNSDKMFAPPVGYDLVWRNCIDDFKTPVSIWHPRAPEGYVSLGCVVVPYFAEPEVDYVYCVAESLCEETTFEEQKIWSAPDSYPWACHIYQSNSDALHFVALRQPREESDWKPKRVLENPQQHSCADHVRV